MIKTRIAPSPTGDPHIGTAYTALFNYAFAKKNKGKFVLRIEDTDRTRFVKDSEARILESLKWLGLVWDEGPFRQSGRLELYQKTAEDLVKKGAAYYCDCSLERLSRLREEQQAKKELSRYDRKCRLKPPEKLKTGSLVVRLKVPEKGETSFEDQVRGKITFQHKDIDDSVILKSDGWPTYHLASVVDDFDMRITHVIRAEEWLSSTPKHVLLYKALGQKPPVYIHLPLLRNRDKSKISKRKNPVSLAWYREQGFLPEAILNYLGLMGWSMPDGREVFSLMEFINEFDVGRIDPSGPVFDTEKLEWLNGEWIRSLSIEDLVNRVKEFSKRELAQIKRVLPLVYERMKKLSEFDSLTEFIFGEVKPDLAQIVKSRDEKLKKDTVNKIGIRLEEVSNWVSGDIERTVEAEREKIGWAKGELYMILRVAVSGSTATPPLFETMQAIGKGKTIARLKKI